jgi:ATP-binding cassette, subfamily B, bacterial
MRWRMPSKNKFEFYRQLNAMDCGPACLRMIAKYYGRHFNAESLRESAGYGKEGVSLLGVSEAAERIGFRSRGVRLTYNQLKNDVTVPCILHWRQYHFVVLTRIKKRSTSGFNDVFTVADPSKGMMKYKGLEFLESWSSGEEEGEAAGIALLLQPSPEFYEMEGESKERLRWRWIFKYLRDSKWQMTQVFIALTVASLLQLILPFLTQSIVDNGIATHNLQYVTVVLIAQLMLVFSRSLVDFIRSRLLLRVSVIVNLSVLSDFWIKLTRLPLSYFDRHHTGDTLQRIGDNKLVQSFLTGSALNTFFSIFNFLIYAIVLASYNMVVFFIFTAGSIIYFIWIRLFLKLRRKINYQTFYVSAKENNATLQLIQGMQEIRLHNAEQLKRWEWENIQASIFKLNFKTLTYSQLQQAGALLINQGKDIIVSFLVAALVIDGKLTLGAMLAIQYIIGQLTSPVEQFVGFIQNAQDAKISIERLNDVHRLKDEESEEMDYVRQLPQDKSIRFSNLSFTYPGSGSDPVLKDITLEIPEGKVTAIVGVSGSGKTTLLKLLLQFYPYSSGEIRIGGAPFLSFSPSYWRRQCGAVMQDGYIFNDSIARNIAVGDLAPEYARLMHSCRIANILSFIETLPAGFNTQLGSEGVGLSTGQKQRLLISRAVYKDPAYLFFDEATNSLDANNERTIVDNLQEFFMGRTVVIVAHRLSTVRNADKIVVMHEGVIVEEGTHLELCGRKSKYYELIKNQLELGN